MSRNPNSSSSRVSSLAPPAPSLPLPLPRPHPNDPPERLDRMTRLNELKRMPERVDTDAQTTHPNDTTETKGQGRAGQTSCTNVHKSNLGSQLSIFWYGFVCPSAPSPERPSWTSWHGRPNDLPERHDRNEGTRESCANELHERAQIQPRVTT